MDRLPCELLYHIFWYIDQQSDLLQMSRVCSHWQSLLMSDEYFLNRWFSRSLKCSRMSYYFFSAFYRDGCKPLWGLNLDESLFPTNLRSSRCDFLPWIVSRWSSNYEDIYEYCYSLSLCDSSHSFSLWLFLPRHYELNIQIGNCNVKCLNILLCSDEKYHFDNGESVSIADRWIHIVLLKMDSQSNYRICIDVQYLTKFSQCQISFNDNLEEYHSLFNILLCRKFGNRNPSEISSEPRIADFNAFKRCLTLVEIRAIHQQQISIKQVKVGTYIHRK